MYNEALHFVQLLHPLQWKGAEQYCSSYPQVAINKIRLTKLYVLS